MEGAGDPPQGGHRSRGRDAPPPPEAQHAARRPPHRPHFFRMVLSVPLFWLRCSFVRHALLCSLLGEQGLGAEGRGEDQILLGDA